jgi:hypothetical protein
MDGNDESNTQHTNQKVMEEFLHNVREELDLCDPGETPYLCANLAGEDRFEKIDMEIVRKVIKQKITIGEAIVQLEKELNPNAYGE